VPQVQIDPAHKVPQLMHIAAGQYKEFRYYSCATGTIDPAHKVPQLMHIAAG
jgi:hypothetical protein